MEGHDEYGPATDLELAIVDRLQLHLPPVGPLTEAQAVIEHAFQAWQDAQERMCHAQFSTGGFDPYGTSCDLEAGHDGPHECHDPFGVEGGKVRWRGGGTCAGDPLPYRDVEWVRPWGQS